ncbi:3cb82229-52f8-4308-ac80-a137bbc7162f [Sclerotinia trifoliorum]|uniref:3cb82229-52f8-4308-ac80-a137bbc7162f n=1 Tax=Sclerotinia trifoliorum TaxID=28548 RepID=A0A8H2ZU79_9HELO|nr:3cb82229-52f8-4308-ac80-a137bbc7162f [Sclerotinia trifoliorum]
MKLTFVAVLAIAASLVPGAYINGRLTNSTIDNQSSNDTAVQNQPAGIPEDGPSNINNQMESSGLDRSTTASEAIKYGAEVIEHIIEDIAEDIAEEIEDEFTDDTDSTPLSPGRLCSKRRKPRCCEKGGRIYRDGCERFSQESLPVNRDEFRSTCTEMGKRAMCCANTIDMAQIGFRCRRARK